jgi:hypothetical protein
MPDLMPPVFADDGFAEVPESERKIIKNGGLTLQVDDTEMTRFEVEKKLKDMDGTIQNINSWQVRPGALGYNITARVPAETLESALVDLGKMGEKTAENITSTDITRQYYDAENRLKNLRIRRDRLQSMLEFETESLADVLSVDRELSSVQTQLENLQNQQNRRDTDVAFSTLNISIQPLPQIGDLENPHWSVNRSWRAAVNNLLQQSYRVFDTVLKYVVLAPLWGPVLLAIVLFVRWWRRRKKARK